MSIGMEGCGPNPRVYSKADYDALHAEAEALRVALLGIASVNPAERGIEWAKSYASDGLKGSGSELYARWLDAFNEAEALRAENGRLTREAKNDAIAYKAVIERQEQLREERDSFQREGIRAMEQLEAARGLLLDIFCTCNLREMPSEHAIRDISNQIEALLTTTQAPEVRNTEQDDDEARHDAVKEIHDVMAAVPCSSLYSLAEAVLDAGYVKSAEQGERQEAVPEIVCRRLLFAFGLECNSIGLLGAAENLHKGMKEADAAHRQAQQGGSHDT